MARKLLDSHQVSDLLGIKEATLRIWRMSGKGPKFFKVGNLVRYAEEDVERYITAQTYISTSQKAPEALAAASA